MSAYTKQKPPFGRTELALAALAACLFAAWAFVWDRVGLLHAGPIAYGNHEACDAWYYFGLSVLPKAGLLTVPGTRTLSRVMYFGVVHELRSLVPWLGLAVLSYFLFLPLALASLYIALRATFSRATAALAVLILGTSPLMLNMMSTTYVTVAALAYGCGMLMCLMWAGRLSASDGAASNALFAAGGLLFAWAANANIIAIEFLFFFCAFALIGRIPATNGLPQLVKYLCKAGALFVVGATAGVVITMLFAQLLGLGLLSPFNQVRAAVEGVGAGWQYEGWQAESVGPLLPPLAAILLASALWQARRRSGARKFDLVLVAGIATATCAYNFFATLVLGDQGLVYDYFYFLILPCIGLAFCAAFDDAIAAADPRKLVGLFAAVIGFVLVFNAAMALSDGVKGLLFSRPHTVSYASLFVLALIVALANKARFGTVLVAIVSVTVLLQTAAHRTLMTMYYHPREPMQRHTEMAEAALGFIFRHLDGEPVLWLAKGDDFRLPLPIVRGLQRCRFAGAFPDALPDPNANAQPPLAPGRTVIVIDGAARRVDQIEAALQPYGYRLDISATRHFALDWRQSVQITIGKVRAL